MSEEIRMQFLLIVICVPVMVFTYQEGGNDLKSSAVEDDELLGEIPERIKRAVRTSFRSSVRTVVRNVRSSSTRRNVVLIRRTYSSHNDETSGKVTCVNVIDSNVNNTAMNTSFTSKNISMHNYNNSSGTTMNISFTSNNSVTRNSSTVKSTYVCTENGSGLQIESSYRVLIGSILLVTVSLKVVYNDFY